MKKTFGMICGAPFRSAGVALLFLFTYVPLSRAEVIINNTGDSLGSYVLKTGNPPLAQVFTMSGTSGNLSSLTVELRVYGAGSVNIDLYSAASGGAPISLLSALGTVSSATIGDQSFTLSLQNNPLLTAGGTYAIVLETPTSGQFGWQATATSASGGTGTLGDNYYYSGGSWSVASAGYYWQMNLQTTPIPEVPITGAVMGFGALALAVGRTLHRKHRSAASTSI